MAMCDPSCWRSGAGGAVLAGALTIWFAALPASGGEPPPRHHPHDIVAAVGMTPSYPADPRLFVASPGTMNLFLVSDDHAVTWKPARTGVRGAVFRAIGFASDWATSQTMYLVTEDGGLQVSTDAGRRWQPPVCNQRLRHIAVAPVGRDGERALFFAGKDTVFASFDGGTTHEAVLRTGEAHVESLAVSPQFAGDRVVFVGLSTGQLRISSDAGRTWQTTRLPASVTSIEPSATFAADRRLWIGTWGAGVQRSDDGGATFQECWAGMTDLEVNQVRAARSGDAFDVFACTRNAGLYRSGDGGESWELTPLAVEKTHQTDNHYTSLLVSPSWPRDRTVLCGTFEGLNVSRDGGKTWRESNINPSRIGRILTFSKKFATDGHVFGAGYGMHLLVSENRGADWDLRFTGLNAVSVYSIAPSPDFARFPILLLGAVYGVRGSIDGGRTWRQIQFEKGEKVEPAGQYTTRAITWSPAFPLDKRVFTVTTKGRFYRSVDYGLTWQPTRQVTDWATGIALSPDFLEDRTLFVSGAGVWISEDAGETFHGPLFDALVYGNYLTVAPDFRTSGELYAIARYRGFVIGKDRGREWVASNEGLEGYAPMAMRLSPDFAADGTIFILTSGGGLFRSRDRGRSWSRVTELGGLLDQAFTLAISPDFANDRTMMAGTFSGFVRSRDGGATWQDTLRTEFYDDKRDPWQRRGKWEFVYDLGVLGISVSRSDQAGAGMLLEFDGVGCKVIGASGPGHGICEVFLDGEPRRRVDQFAAEFTAQQVLFEIDGLEPGPHRIEIRVTGEKSPRSSGTQASVDAAYVHYR